MSSPLFASVAETADLLGISDDLVYDLIARGELPSSTFGRRKLVPRKAIDLVVDAALDGFDPDRLASTLATAAGASTSTPPDDETPPTATGPEPDPTLRPSGAPHGAPVAAT